MLIVVFIYYYLTGHSIKSIKNSLVSFEVVYDETFDSIGDMKKQLVTRTIMQVQ